MDEYCQHESLSKECMKRENSSEKKFKQSKGYYEEFMDKIV